MGAQKSVAVVVEIVIQIAAAVNAIAPVVVAVGEAEALWRRWMLWWRIETLFLALTLIIVRFRWNPSVAPIQLVTI